MRDTTLDFGNVRAALLAGMVSLSALGVGEAKAQTTFPGDMIRGLATTITKEPEIVRGVIRGVLERIKEDEVWRRSWTSEDDQDRFAHFFFPPLNFTSEPEDRFSAADEAFAALGYAKAPRAPAAPPVPTYVYGFNLIGSGDVSRTAGVSTTIGGATAAFDVTKIGIFSQYDALTFVLTGAGLQTSAPGFGANTGIGAGTLAYTSGNFSADFTITGNSTRAKTPSFGAPPAITNTTGASYAPNLHYKIDLGGRSFVEPTVGAVYTQSFTAGFGSQTADNTQVSGGARFGTTTKWGNTQVEPSVLVEAFSLVAQNPSGGSGGTTFINGIPITTGAAGGTPTGAVGGRASGKLNFIFSPAVSAFAEGHGSSISGTNAYGGSAGVRWTF